MPDRCPYRENKPCVDDVCAHSDDCPWPPAQARVIGLMADLERAVTDAKAERASRPFGADDA